MKGHVGADLGDEAEIHSTLHALDADRLVARPVRDQQEHRFSAFTGDVREDRKRDVPKIGAGVGAPA